MCCSFIILRSVYCNLPTYTISDFINVDVLMDDETADVDIPMICDSADDIFTCNIAKYTNVKKGKTVN